MSKSRGNVINPDDVVKQYGADALRLYEMFMGPLEQVKPCSTQGVEGVFRYLNRVWRLIINEETGKLNDEVVDSDPDRGQLKVLHETIRKVTEDIEGIKFNTAISALMIFNNEAQKWEKKPREVLQVYVRLLSPFAPHLSEELWKLLGNTGTLAYEPWPEWKEEYLRSETHVYAIQVNGKVRGQIEVPSDKAVDKTFVLDQARKQKTVAKYLNEGNVVKEIFVPKKIINFVVK